MHFEVFISKSWSKRSAICRSRSILRSLRKRTDNTMKKSILLLLAVLLLTACGQDKEGDREAIYMNITAEEAKQIMDSEEGYIILDVRTQEEYD